MLNEKIQIKKRNKTPEKLHYTYISTSSLCEKDKKNK